MNLLQGSTSYTRPTPDNSRIRRALLALLIALIGAVAIPALTEAATINAVHGPTLTGTAPWDAAPGPGNDVSETDDVVRTNDFVTYTWAISVNDGSSPNTTITQVLPPGIEWETPLPAFCLTTGVTPPSSISADRSTIVCNLGDKDDSTGSADQYPVVAKVRGDVPNAMVISTNFTVSSSDPDTSDVSPANPVVTNVSAAPRVNLIKSTPAPPQGFMNHNGVDGTWVLYPVSLAVDSIGGKGSKGNELLTTPINFEDAFTVTPGGINFELVGCGRNGGTAVISNLPGGQGGTATSVTQSGVPACSQSGGPGSDISFTIPAAADLTGEHRPTQTANGNPVPANRTYLATYWLRIFIPNSEILAAGGAVNVANVYEDFDAESISGQPNVEPLEDNIQSIDVEAQQALPGSIVQSKFFGPAGNYSSDEAWSQNQHVFPGQVFWGYVHIRFAGQTPFPAGAIALCDMFDNTSFHLTLEGDPGTDPARPGFLASGVGTTGMNGIIEYGTGGVRGYDPDGWFGPGGTPPGTRDDNCADDASPAGWHQDPADLGVPMDEITKVRVRFPGVFSPGESARLYMKFKARNVGLGETEILPTGTILANFTTRSSNYHTANPTWRINDYDPGTLAGEIGRRVILTRGAVRLQKDSDPSNQTTALSGDVISYRLNVTATGADIPGGIMPDMVVRDTLDEYQVYVAGSASPAPTDIIENGDGTTTLVWELGDRPIGEVIPDITYDARLALNTPNNYDVINRAVVSSPEDASDISERSDQHQIRATQKAGILIEKSTSTPWVEPRDQLGFRVDYVNNSVSDLDGLESIDILPWNGDTRGSNFHGTVSLDAVTVHDGQTIYYTSRPPASVSDNPRDASNGSGGSTQWCTEVQLGTSGCPMAIGDSTAVRVVSTGNVPRFTALAYDIVLNTNGNRSGDIYGNRAGLATQDNAVLLPANSPQVHDQVVASVLGDYVWIDANENGIQDPDEHPLPNVTVNLTGTDKHGQSVSLSTTTDGSGQYLFPNLVSGEYEIQFVLPDGYRFTIRGAGSDPAEDSNADPVTGRTGAITIDSPISLQTDQEDLTWDAGVVPEDEPLPDRARLTIVKDARPDADVDFAFDTSGGLPQSGFQLNDDGRGTEDRITFDDLDPGTYGVTERSRDGWRLANVTCNGTATSTVDGATVSIQLAPGQEATCTYVNERVDPLPPDRPKRRLRAKKKPRIVLSKHADRDVVRQGKFVNYRIRIRNLARGSVVRNILVCDNIPRWTSVMHTGRGYFRNGQVCWRIKRLAFSDGYRVRRLRLRIDRDAPAGTRIVNHVRSGKSTASDIVRVIQDRSAVSRAGGVTG